MTCGAHKINNYEQCEQCDCGQYHLLRLRLKAARANVRDVAVRHDPGTLQHVLREVVVCEYFVLVLSVMSRDLRRNYFNNLLISNANHVFIHIQLFKLPLRNFI